MKKIFILALVLVVCTGCVRINKENNKDAIIDEIITNKMTSNTMSMGYEYYLPLGVSKVYDKDYNQKFRFDDTYIYLYVDAVSYYYQNSLNFTEEDTSDSYYYRKIVNGKKTGYIKVTKEDEKSYFVKIIYNYAKIEAYVTEAELEKVLANGMIIITSIDYNDNLIKNILENDNKIGTEKEYKIDKPDDATSKFSEYLSEYVQDETTVPDLPEY